MRVVTKCPKGQLPRKQDNAGYTMGLPHMYPAFFVGFAGGPQLPRMFARSMSLK